MSEIEAPARVVKATRGLTSVTRARGAGPATPFVVAQFLPGSMRITRVDNFEIGQMIENEWAAGEYRYAPGELRAFP